MPKKQQQTRIVSTVKTVWYRRDSGKRTTDAWAKKHPKEVFKGFEHVERKERF